MTDLRRWLLLLRVPAALLGVFLFFALYNRFLLDKNLQNLQTSLSILGASTGAGQAEAALLLVDQTLTTQMAQEEVDLKKISVLQYAQGALAADRVERPVEDAQAMLAILGEDQKQGRPASLKLFDAIVLGGQSFLRQAALLPGQVLGPPLSPEIDIAQLEEAAHLERIGRHAESSAVYETLLKEYPRYSGRASLKLKLGYVVQRMGDLPRAERWYQEALRESRSPDDSRVALRMLQEIPRLQKIRQEIPPLEKRISSLEPGPQRQKSVLRLGTLAVELQDLEKAARAFQEAYRSDPEGDLAVSCLFKEAWTLRTMGRMDEAFDSLREVIRLKPDTEWAVAAYLQMAEIYKTLGELEAAAQANERAIAVKTKDAAILAIAYTQTACTYQFDLNNPQKAQFYSRESARFFPASSFGSVEKRIQDQVRGKNLTASPAARPGGEVGPAPAPRAPLPSLDPLASGSPLMKWIEQFLPLFVETFSDRLARYMEVAGEKELSRRFTQEEFRMLVVRRVQEKFPGTVTNILTEIHPDGFVGACTLRMGPLSLAVRAKVGIVVENERPHAVIQDISVGKLSLPQKLLETLQERVNQKVDQAKYPLKVKQYKLEEGYALIAVELVEE